eukprot:2613388-Pyramimonas_sp.AAC.1
MFLRFRNPKPFRLAMGCVRSAGCLPALFPDHVSMFTRSCPRTTLANPGLGAWPDIFSAPCFCIA